VTDPRAIDVLLLKGRQDYQETMNCWKQTDHVLGILLESKDRPNQTFLQKFYEGESS
jgi:NADH dehydrogenase (ubiquinone) 1 alpha subcomplex subunit 6